MKATHTVSMFDEAGRKVASRTGVPTAEVLEVVIALLREHGWQGRRIQVDGEKRAAITAEPTRPSPQPASSATDVSSVAIAHASKFFLTSDQVLHRLPLLDEGAGDPTLRSGPGPGGLVWQPIEEHGMRGLAASWRRGTFKILRVATGHCALFLERGAGDWESLALGAPDALKQCAGDRAAAPVGAPPLPDSMRRTIDARLKMRGPGRSGA